MTRRDFLKETLAGAAVWPFLSRPALARRKGRRPNIVFVMADDHTSQAWGCYGSRLAQYAPTKKIDGIRKQGALLENCFCTNSICAPSRASILTGQYSHVNGVKTLSGRLMPDQDNVAKRLQESGYETAIVGKWHLKERPSGFDYSNVLRGQGRYHDPVLYEAIGDGPQKEKMHEGHSTDIITDEALRWLEGRKKGEQPFCLMVHYKAVHEPFYSHDRYRSLYEDVEMEEPEDLLWEESPRDKVFEGWPLEILGERFVKKPGNYSPPGLPLEKKEDRRAIYQKFIKDYLRAVAGLDDSVGRLASYLEEKGLAEDTVFIYTADQGYFLGEHNMFDKRFMLEESLRMPFIIRYPREIYPGTTVKDLILNIDFAELMLDYAEGEIPTAMQGRSFRENLKGNTPPSWREAVYYRYWTDQPERPSHYGVRTERHKLIFYDGLAKKGRDPEECWELYDLEADPCERENVYDGDDGLVEDLKRRLRSLQREFGDVEGG